MSLGRSLLCSRSLSSGARVLRSPPRALQLVPARRSLQKQRGHAASARPRRFCSAARSTMLITLSGDDKPGITSEFARVLHEAGCTLLDTNQATIHGKLCLYFLLGTCGGDEKQMLSDLMRKAKEFANLDVKFEMMEDSVLDTRGANEHVITLIGRKVSFRSMATVSEQIAEHGFNIVTINQLTDVTPQLLAWREMDEQARGTLNKQDHAGSGFEDFFSNTDGVVDKKEWDAWAKAGNVTPEHTVNLTRAVEIRIVDVDGQPNTAKALKLQDQLLKVGRELTCDIAMQRESTMRRVKRLVVLDMDSTLIQQEVIDEIARVHGVYDEVREATERAMSGEVDFDESLRMRCAQLEGCPEEVLERVYDSIKLTPGALPFVNELKQQGYQIGVLSGGFMQITQRVATDLGLDFAFANELEIVDGKLTGKLVGPLVNRERKRDLLLSLCQSMRISVEQTIAVGDGANDIEMLKVAGLGIAFNAKPTVQDASKYTISNNRLDSILYLLGVRASDMRGSASPTSVLNFTNRYT